MNANTIEDSFGDKLEPAAWKISAAYVTKVNVPEN